MPDIQFTNLILNITSVLLLIIAVVAAISLRIQWRVSRKVLAPAPPVEGMDEHLLLCAAVVEALPDGIVVVDSHGTIQLVNRELERMSDYHRSKLRGQRVEVLVPAGMRDGHKEKRAQYALNPTVRPMNSGLDTQLQRSDGTTVPVDISLSSEPSREGTIYIATVRRRI